MRKGAACFLAMILASACNESTNGTCQCGPDETCVDGECVPVSPDTDTDTDTDVEQDPAVDRDGESGTCVRSCEFDMDCDDGNPCTADLCDMDEGCCAWITGWMDGNPCGDGLFCNGLDFCDDGECRHAEVDCEAGAPACHEGFCDEEGDRCVFEPMPDGVPCEPDEESQCVSGGFCREGACVTHPVPDGTPCDTGMDNPCVSFETCQAGECVPRLAPTGTPCLEGDGLWCVEGGFCRAGICSEGPPCEPANECQIFECMEDTRICEDLSTELNGTACTTGDDHPCRADGSCLDGACVGDPVPDGTVCTVTAGTFCLAGEGQCHAGECAGTPPCDMGFDCEIARCEDSTASCVPLGPAPDGTPCGLVSPCDEFFCFNGLCEIFPLCYDGNACTDDLCDYSGDCDFIPTPEPCEDCTDVVPNPCDDGDPCTIDECRRLGGSTWPECLTIFDRRCVEP
jgi:hypothetical protein